MKHYCWKVYPTCAAAKAIPEKYRRLNMYWKNYKKNLIPDVLNKTIGFFFLRVIFSSMFCSDNVSSSNFLFLVFAYNFRLHLPRLYYLGNFYLTMYKITK
jgi:hypothetical protein